MKVFMEPSNLNYFEALASQTRLRVIQLLSEKDRNIKELAEVLQVSSSVMTKHVRKLEEAGLITTQNVTKDGKRQKMCMLLNTVTEILVPFKVNRADTDKYFFSISVPVGMFSDIQALPPCGIADEHTIIGNLDEPVHMLDFARSKAQLLWMSEGYVEYMIPNRIQPEHRLTDIEISGEFGSEVAGFNDNWPSVLQVSLNGTHLCTFTTPGDFGCARGTLTPAWWENNQYGILVVIRVDTTGVYVNGNKTSQLTINDLDTQKDRWILRIRTDSSNRSGGLTIFGEKYGNYAQNILFSTFYKVEK